MHTQAIEDYLRTIYLIQGEQGKVATTALAERLAVKPPSATGMIKKLADMGLVIHAPYQGVVLTEAGRQAALQVIRHHRLVELLLAELLDMPWDQVHEEAHKIEHVLSDCLEDRIDVVLGHPTTDPHGAPIPSRDGRIEHHDCVRLANLQPGQSAVVVQVSDHDPALLRYLGELELYPQSKVKVLDLAPFRGPLTIQVGNSEHVLGQEVANHVFVTDIRQEKHTGT